MTKKRELLVLIDASSYFYRAFHALPPLHNSKGEPTGAVYGVLNMIRRLLKDYQADYVGVIFDAKGKTFRDDLYPEYKATRPPMPDDLKVQFKPLLEVIEALGYPLIVVEGVEADDVIGTLARQASKEHVEVLISTGDKDMAQLVNEHITLINTMSNKLLDHDNVIEKFGVPPELIIDYLTLIGDKVDNIPGVDKCGPKTAVKWLTAYDDLDGVMQHADEVTGKVGEYLRHALTHLPLSRELVTIKSDVDLEFSYNDLMRQEPDVEKLTQMFQQLELRSWLKEIQAEQPQQASDYQCILDKKAFDVLLTELNNATHIAVDTETTSLDVMEAELVGLSFSTKANHAVYLPVAHDYDDAPEQLSRDDVLKALKPIFENENIIKIGQNIKYDMNILARYDIQLKGVAFDTMIESYVLNSGGSRHDMDTLASKYLAKSTIKFEDVAGKGAKQVTFNKVPLEQATPYAAEDADITLQLHERLWPEVTKATGLQYVFNELEMKLLPVLAKIERCGVLIDAELLKNQSGSVTKAIDTLTAEAYELAGEEFNLSSTKQLGVILFEKLKLPVLKKTPKGAPSTAEASLQELALDFPLPDVILKFRSLSKLKSTYIDKLPEQINPDTGRVHTSYNQAVAATGRLSSTDPNLQNIPVRTEEGRRIRKAFIAPEGYRIVSADYSQIELRIMAHLSQDEGLLKAFKNGWDVHASTAAEVFGVPLDQVSRDQRRNAKAINFGLIYGMSAFGLSRQIGIERNAAQAYIDAYFARYPGVHEYMEATRAKAHDKGYVETIFGRRLYLPEINTRNLQRQRAAERTAINAPLQGSAADIIKLAMISIDDLLNKGEDDAEMIMQVHDELVFEVANDQIDNFVKKVEEIMCHVVTLTVPMTVGIGIGDNWDEAH